MQLRAAILLCLWLPACSASESKRSEDRHPLASAGARSETKASEVLRGNAPTSYWIDGDAARAAQLFDREEWQAASEAFAGLAPKDESEGARISLMLAISQAKLGQHQPAAKRLDELVPALPLLRDFLQYNAARSHYFGKALDQALERARAVAPTSIHGADAELLIGDVLRAKGDPQAIYDHYKGYLDTRKNGIRRAEARYHMASAAAAMGHGLEAADHFRAITIESPLTAWAERAETASAAIKLSSEDRERLTTLSAEEHISRGKVFYDNNRSELSEAEYRSALTATGLTPELACVAAFHQANSVYKLRDRPKAVPLFLAALERCEKAGNADLYVKSAYQLGKSYTTLGEREKAIQAHGLIEAKHPEHSYADDARLLAAEEYRDLGKADKETELLESLPAVYPGGDMSTEALWRLAFRAYKDKKYDEAIAWLEKQIESAPIDDRFWAEGQAQYWIARSQARRGKTTEAVAAYRDVIEHYPLSYYALLALNRLRESHGKVFEEVVADIHKAPPAGEGEFNFRDRPEYQTQEFARAIEFLRLGLASEASSELSLLGFRSPQGRDRLRDADEIDRTWAVSFLHHSIGDYARALWSTRWHVLDYKRHWPEGAWRKRWDIAYPPGYWQLIEKHAKDQGIPTELLISFVREESGFSPIQESVANAIGLSQLIMPTAQRFAEGTGIEVSRESLRNPDKNLLIGSRFMSFLMRKWNQDISLVVPSYNAGEGAVARWVAERGTWPRDEFMEEIPYDETRHYSKRVIASYFTYRYLLRDEIPTFAFE